MRSTLEIIIAVKESKPVEVEELRLALLALNSIDHFRSNSLNDLIEAIEENAKSIKLKANFAKDMRERMFQAIKTDPAKWLGPTGIPGNKEHDDFYRLAKDIAKKAIAVE